MWRHGQCTLLGIKGGRGERGIIGKAREKEGNIRGVKEGGRVVEEIHTYSRNEVERVEKEREELVVYQDYNPSNPSR